jgi:hypothetical protein
MSPLPSPSPYPSSLPSRKSCAVPWLLAGWRSSWSGTELAHHHRSRNLTVQHPPRWAAPRSLKQILCWTLVQSAAPWWFGSSLKLAVHDPSHCWHGRAYPDRAQSGTLLNSWKMCEKREQSGEEYEKSVSVRAGGRGGTENAPFVVPRAFGTRFFVPNESPMHDSRIRRSRIRRREIRICHRRFSGVALLSGLLGGDEGRGTRQDFGGQCWITFQMAWLVHRHPWQHVRWHTGRRCHSWSSHTDAIENGSEWRKQEESEQIGQRQPLTAIALLKT